MSIGGQGRREKYRQNVGNHRSTDKILVTIKVQTIGHHRSTDN